MSLTKRIIPCLDIDKGRVVKGVNFTDIRDAGDPVVIAKSYNDQNADEITFLDITASHDKRSTILDVVQKVASEVFIPLTVGGGVKTCDDIRALLNAGADKVSINTSAILNPNIIRDASERFGNQCIVVALDVKQVNTQHQIKRWEIFTHGGRRSTGLDAIEWACRMVNYGAGELLLTSMDRDGTGSGFDLDLVSLVSDTVNVPVIASGGVGNFDHLVEGIKIGHAAGVLAAGIFHFDKKTIIDAKNYMRNCGVNVRL